MSPLKELLKRVEVATDLDLWARRELDGEIHCALSNHEDRADG